MRSKGKAMVKKQLKGVMPTLRFPGFTAECKSAPLSRLASRSARRNSDEQQKRVLTNSAEHGILDQRDYFDKDIADKENLQSYYVVEKGDFVYNPRISNAAPVGPISQNEIATGVMSPLYTVFRFHSSDSAFFAHFFKSSRWHEYLRKNSSTGARHDRMSIGTDVFMQMPVPDMDPDEQKKISEFLSALDVCIGAETRKLDALRAHKQGLIQQLFPTEGQCLPRLRFSGFKDEWIAKLLKDVAPLQRGFDLPSNQLRPGRIPVVYSNGVQNFHVTGMATAPGIVTGRSGTIGKINFVASGDYWPHNTTLWVTSFCGNVPLFVYYLFKFVGIERFASGSGVPTLNRNDVHIFQVHVPSPTEQTRIASCVSSLDDLLAAQSRKLDALKQHKKGLVQGLFPVIEAHAP